MEDAASIFPINPPTNEEKKTASSIKTKSELNYYQQLKKKYKNYLLDGLTAIEKERIAQWIINEYNKNIQKHKELCDRLTEYDSVYRMERKEVIGSDGNLPNYRTPLSTVALDVVHANEMNVFFSPKDPIRPIPTEPNDAPKISKLSTFSNWSMKNELELFDNIDRLFHSSNKNGECPYMIYWDKEWGIDFKRTIVSDPNDPKEPLYDEDTGEVVYREEEVPTLLYNGPKFEIINRKDYIQPNDAVMGVLPPWEMVIRRYSYDDIWKEELSGRMYEDVTKDVKNWGMSETPLNEKVDYQGDEEKVGEWEKETIFFMGKLRVNVIKNKSMGQINEKDIEEIQELEDEFLAEVHIQSKTLLSLRKNKFPLKMRPVDMDYCIPDDEGRRSGIGMIEFLSSIQKAYDILFNNYLYGVMQSNNPFGFFKPTGNMRNDPIKIQNGFLYPTSDPQATNMIVLPPPNQSMQTMIELLTTWAQLLFGISDYTAGIDSQVDSNAPARKAQIIVDQGNVRLNMIIKRKIQTLKNICLRWYLLYRDNMPKDKYMRIVGDDENDPWKFEPIRLEDFKLKSLPDFELTGNILSSNKQLQANSCLALYQVLISNPFYSPQTTQGMQALHSLTKWLIDKLDDTGVSRFLPKMPGDSIETPEEENARFLQGDNGNPTEGDDHLDHIKKHMLFMQNTLIPDEIKPNMAQHIAKHVEMLRQQLTQQAVMQTIAQHMPQGANNGQVSAGLQAPQGQAPVTTGVSPAVLPKQMPTGPSSHGRVPGLSV